MKKEFTRPRLTKVEKHWCRHCAIGWMIWGLIPRRDKKHFLPQLVWTGSGAYPATYSTGITGSFFMSKVILGVNLTTHIHLVLMLRMIETITAAPLYFHDMQRDTTLTLAYQAATDYVTYNIGIINQLLENHSFCHTHHVWHPASILWEWGAATFGPEILWRVRLVTRLC